MTKKLFLSLASALLVLASCQKADQNEIIVSSTDNFVSAKTKTLSINLRANCDYDVEILPDAANWLSLKSKSQNYLELSLTENTGTERKTQVSLSAGGKTLASFMVTQGAPDPELIYPAPENKVFRRVAYFPNYRENDESAMPDDFLQTVDIACFAFATINDDYIVKLQTGKGDLNTLVTRCHKLGIKVILSLNGSWLDKRYVTMSQSSSLRKKFIDSVMAIVNQYGLDGVDNDWEYPSSKDGSQKGNLFLMRELSNILHAPGANKFLTMAINPGVYTGQYTSGIDDGVFDCVDWFGSMIYDDYSESTPGKNHASWKAMETSYNYWVVTRKLPASKFVGGIPAYGRPSGISQSGNTLTFASIIAQGGDPDADEATVTTSAHPAPFTIYYNGRVMVRNKVEFYQEHNCGGYFFWEAGQDLTDDRSLLRTAAAAIK